MESGRSEHPRGTDDVPDGAVAGVAADLGQLMAVDASGLADEAARLHLLELHAARCRLEAAVVAATGVVDRRGLYAADGARSCATWLAGRVDQTRGACVADGRLARVLAFMPVTADAFRSGRLGRVKVDLLAETRTPEVAEVFDDQEEFLVTRVIGLVVRDARRFVAAWLEQARLAVGYTDPDEPLGPMDPPESAVDLSPTFDGRWILEGEFDATEGTTLSSAITAEIDHLFHVGTFKADDGMLARERRGVALMNIICGNARSQTRNGAPRPSIEVLCDERTLLGRPIVDPLEDGGEDLRSRVCELVDGTPVSVRTLGRLLCGADVHRLVVNAAGEVLDAGKTIRLANRAQRRALRYRHARHCAFPGCDAPVDWTEAHHVEHWNPDPSTADGGSDLANLVPLCRFHHHRVHEGRFELILDPDGEVRVLRPPDSSGRRCRITPAKAHHQPRPPDPDALLARQRIRDLVSNRG